MSKKFPETQKVAVLSTAHLSIRDHDLLEALVDGRPLSLGDEAYSIIPQNEWGYFIYAQDEGASTEGLKRTGFSDSFIALMNEARKAGFDWVRFDCDGLQSEAFPTFEWPSIREEMVSRVERQFKAIFTARLNGDPRAEANLLRGVKYGLAGKLGVHAGELMAGAKRLGIEMRPRSVYPFMFGGGVHIGDDEFYIFADDGQPVKYPVVEVEKV